MGCELCVEYCVLRIMCYALSNVYCWSRIACRVLLVMCFVLRGVCCLSVIVQCVDCVVYCVFGVVYCVC